MGNIHPSMFVSRAFYWVSGPTGGDSKNMNGVYGAGTPGVYEVKVPAGETYLVGRVNFQMVDKLTTLIKFGGLAELTNGMKVEAIGVDGTTVLLDFLDGVTIKKNIDFNRLAGRDVAGVEDSKTTDGIAVRWTLSKAANKQVILYEGESLRLTHQDSYNGIDEFRSFLQGETT